MSSQSPGLCYAATDDFHPQRKGWIVVAKEQQRQREASSIFFCRGNPMGLPEHTAASLAADEKVKLHQNHSPTRSIGRNIWLNLCYSNNNNNNIVFLVSLLSIGSWNYLNRSVYSVYTSGSTIASVSFPPPSPWPSPHEGDKWWLVYMGIFRWGWGWLVAICW